MVGTMESWLQDVRLGLRSFWTAPGSFTAAVLILALGTGLNTAVFAVAYGVLLRPLPYSDQSSLVQLVRAGSGTGNFVVSLSAFDDWQARLRVLEVAAYDRAAYTLRSGGEPRVIQVALVTDRFFDVLGATPLRGQRSLSASAPSVVLSARLARTLTAESGGTPPPSVRIGSALYPVSAVMPDDVTFPAEDVDAWLPIRAAPAIQVFGSARQRRVRTVARLHAGVSVAQARDDVRRVEDDLARDRPAGLPDRGHVDVVRLAERLTGHVRPILGAFAFAAVLVLLITCANVASLLIARAMAREREVALRMALGAGRARVLRAYLVEGLLLALAGSIVGVLLAYGGVRSFVTVGSSVLPRLEAVAVDVPVLVASVAVAALVALLCALAPGLHVLRTDVAPAFRQQGPVGRRTARRLSGALIVAQVATAIVLLTGAGLLTRTVVGLLDTDIGIDTDGAVAVQLMLTETAGQQAPERTGFVHDLLTAVETMPGVRRAGLGTSLPPASSTMSIGIYRVDVDGNPRAYAMNLGAVTPGYFGGLGVRLVRGRLFDERDATDAASVVVVSSTVAQDFFPDENPIGRELPVTVPGGRPGRPRVVGVVEDVIHGGLERAPSAAVYVPWDHLPVGDVYLVVRTDGDPLAMVPAIREAIRRLDPAQPIGVVQSLEAAVSGSVADRRLYAFLAVSVALLALTVALVGLAATLSRAVSERRRELAIRAALGASPLRTVRSVMRDGALLGLVGLGVGLGAAVVAARGLSALLYGVGPFDLPTYFMVAVTIVVTVLLACFIPAHRAAQISPAELMRTE